MPSAAIPAHAVVKTDGIKKAPPHSESLHRKIPLRDSYLFSTQQPETARAEPVKALAAHFYNITPRCVIRLTH